MRNIPFWAPESRLDTRTTDTLVKPPTTAPGSSEVRHMVRSGTFKTSRSYVFSRRLTPTCARTHADAAWEAVTGSAIVFGLPSALRLGGKT